MHSLLPLPCRTTSCGLCGRPCPRSGCYLLDLAIQITPLGSGRFFKYLESQGFLLERSQGCRRLKVKIESTTVVPKALTQDLRVMKT